MHFNSFSEKTSEGWRGTSLTTLRNKIKLLRLLPWRETFLKMPDGNDGGEQKNEK